MRNDVQTVPVACNPLAMSTECWTAHQATTSQLFSGLREASEELPDGYAFRFPATALPAVAAFVDGERRCCPFLNFGIEIPPAEAPITLRITGNAEAKALIAAELLTQ